MIKQTHTFHTFLDKKSKTLSLLDHLFIIIIIMPTKPIPIPKKDQSEDHDELLFFTRKGDLGNINRLLKTMRMSFRIRKTRGIEEQAHIIHVYGNCVGDNTEEGKKTFCKRLKDKSKDYDIRCIDVAGGTSLIAISNSGPIQAGSIRILKSNKSGKITNVEVISKIRNTAVKIHKKPEVLP